MIPWWGCALIALSGLVMIPIVLALRAPDPRFCRCGHVEDAHAPEGVLPNVGACAYRACGCRAFAHEVRGVDPARPGGDRTVKLRVSNGKVSEHDVHLPHDREGFLS